MADLLEDRIAAGDPGPGERLPPIRALADALSLAPNTVALAYRRLADRGVVAGRGRAGTFVSPGFGPAPAHPPVPEGLVDLASGNPDPSLLPDLDRFLPGIADPPVLYGEEAVEPSLRTQASRRLEEAGVPVERLAVVGGALDGVERALGAHLRVGDAVAIEAPGWPAFFDLVTAMGMRPIPVPVDEGGMRPECLDEVVGEVQAVVLTPRVQNPTGAVIDAERSAALRRLLDPHPGVLVVEDDHGGLISGVELAAVSPGRPRWAFVQSVSKSLGPDLRLAFLTGDQRTVDRVVARQSAGPGWVSHLLQRLVAAILSDPGTPELLERAIAAYAERRQALIAALAAVGIPATGPTGLGVWVPVPDEEPAVQAMAAAGYAIRAGARWRMGAPPAVRISIGCFDPATADEVASVLASAVAPVRSSRTA